MAALRFTQLMDVFLTNLSEHFLFPSFFPLSRAHFFRFLLDDEADVRDSPIHEWREKNLRQERAFIIPGVWVCICISFGYFFTGISFVVVSFQLIRCAGMNSKFVRTFHSLNSRSIARPKNEERNKSHDVV